MPFAEEQAWLELLEAGNEQGLAELAATAGFGEPGKTAANLCMLTGTIADNATMTTNHTSARMARSFRAPDCRRNACSIDCGSRKLQGNTPTRRTGR